MQSGPPHSRMVLRRGERARMEAYFPHFNIRMGCELGRTCMLIYMVTMANAATSPIILPFALWWFLIGWIFWRYSILYVFERSTESGGMVRSQRACIWTWGQGCAVLGGHALGQFMHQTHQILYVSERRRGSDAVKPP